MIRILFLLLGMLFSLQPAQGQEKYWIFFTEKDTMGFTPEAHLSGRTLTQRQGLGLPLWQFTDVPVSPVFLRKLQEAAVSPLVVSRWLNACSAYLSPEQVEEVRSFPFVADLRPVQTLSLSRTSYDSTRHELGTALEQMDGTAFQEAGLDGSGVLIGVIDAGFYAADRSHELKHLFEEKRILGVRDYLKPERKNHFSERETFSDNHGTTVLEHICGLGRKEQKGAATAARFYLARTDHGVKEARTEEDHWVAAMEWMDSLGVRLINSSLGYSFGFDLPEEDYKVSEMDGKTAITTRAAQLAVTEKGLIIICSAGNEGNDTNWRILSAPADAEGVIAVGATNTEGGRMNYSSIGPESLPYVKPDVACFSLFGTSFAAPVITGFAACLLQQDSTLTSWQLNALLKESAHLYPHPNNYIGYGIPHAGRALKLLDKEKLKPLVRKEKSQSALFHRLKLRGHAARERLVVFHKKDSFNVVKQEYVKAKNGILRLKRPRNAKFSTLVWDQGGLEIIWKDE